MPTHPNNSGPRDNHSRDSVSDFLLATSQPESKLTLYELYFPDEMHAAGLHLFDLVATTQLPEEDQLSTLRKKFDDLYDIKHPLRAALEKLHTHETVRIIEGKASPHCEPRSP